MDLYEGTYPTKRRPRKISEHLSRVGKGSLFKQIDKMKKLDELPPTVSNVGRCGDKAEEVSRIRTASGAKHHENPRTSA